MLEAQERIIGVANDRHVTPNRAPAPSQSPEVEDIVEIDVRQQGRDDRPLRRPHLRLTESDALHHTRGKPLANQPQYSLIPDTMGQKTLGPPQINRVEELAEVRIYDPVDLALLDSDKHCIERIMLIAPPPKAIGEADKVALVDGVE